MSIDRAAITSGLSELIESHLSKTGGPWAKEVSIESLDRVRPDFMSVEASKGVYAKVSNIERACVTIYEVKSCLADYMSGNGLNDIGDFNYIVCPYELMMKVIGLVCDEKMESKDPEGRWGWAYPFPESHGRRPCIDDLPTYEGQVDGWKLYFIPPHIQYQRKLPISVCLYALICAGVRR